MNPKIDRDAETGDYYEVEQGFTKRDWVLGGFWVVVGVFGLVLAHIHGQMRKIRGW
jgi:hypothetical protein